MGEAEPESRTGSSAMSELDYDWTPAPPPRHYPVEPGFLPQGDSQVYYVHHSAHGDRKGKVLLVGPFANERTCSMTTWRRWSEFLAQRGLEVLRFDYRGMGESSGDFKEMGLDSWLDDTRLVFEHFEGGEDVPIIINGLRLGALLASHHFAEGAGHGLLMWDPPRSTVEMLKQTLRVRLTVDMAADPDAKRVTRDEYISQIEKGEFVNVEGFHWGEKLWTSATQFETRIPDEDERRPHWVIHLDKRPPSRVLSPGRSEIISLKSPPFWKLGPFLAPDLTDLFESSVAKIHEWLDKPIRER
jgi:hypothetical protein